SIGLKIRESVVRIHSAPHPLNAFASEGIFFFTTPPQFFQPSDNLLAALSLFRRYKGFMKNSMHAYYLIGPKHPLFFWGLNVSFVVK
ncbi:hypothetical protein, partial [uncultured Imperialibacter sp.]|uniref:hypothetical protein n=1 Tax=uncultured Imperialibacter sp. TaxID=1672639 RepID=UPI0030D79C14